MSLTGGLRLVEAVLVEQTLQSYYEKNVTIVQSLSPSGSNQTALDICAKHINEEIPRHILKCKNTKRRKTPSSWIINVQLLAVFVSACLCVCVRAYVHVCEAHSWHFILLYVNTYFVYYLLFIYFYYPSRDKPGPLFNLRLFRSDRRILWVNRSPPFSQFAHHVSVTSHTPMKGFTLTNCCQENTHGLSGIIWHLSYLPAW